MTSAHRCINKSLSLPPSSSAGKTKQRYGRRERRTDPFKNAGKKILAVFKWITFLEKQCMSDSWHVSAEGGNQS